MRKLILLFSLVVFTRFNSVDNYYPGFRNVHPIKQQYYYYSPYKVFYGSNPGTVYYTPSYGVIIR